MARVMHGTAPPPQILSAGVTLRKIQPGGRFGPNDEVAERHPGGRTWNDGFTLGGPGDAFQMHVPDIRLPPNQLWPLHWHDCWIAVVILDGSCVIGDWWMQKGDVLITAAGVEYGPLLNGPEGCQMFEVFAQLHLAPGGYAPEYSDHPTLQGVDAAFKPRSAINLRNQGKQMLAMEGLDGFVKGRLSPGAVWDLGEADDPLRGVLRCTGLVPGEVIAAHHYDDWHGIFLLEGAMQLGSEQLICGDVLMIEPGSPVAEFTAGSDGALLFEASRTAQGSVRIFEGNG